MELIEQILMYALAVVGGASLIVAGLEKIADVTPSTKDDLYVGKAKRAIGYVAAILDKLAVNPKRP
jgi:hypothetical protein